MDTSARTEPAPAASLGHIADGTMMLALLVAAAAAAAIGFQNDALPLALALSGALLVAGGMGFAAARGSFLSRIVLAICLGGLVALHIQLGRGRIEYHFGVFVALSLLMVYRDWRPIVALAGFFAAHHLLFDRLQSMGVGVFCTTEPSFLVIVLHVSYVVVQTGLEVTIAVKMRGVALEGDELTRLARAVDRDEAVMLDLGAIAVRTPGAIALKRAVARMEAALSQVQSSATSIQVASVQIASGNQDLSSRTEQTVSRLQETSTSMEQLTGTMRHATASAHEANRLAATAADAASRGGAVVAQVVSTMSEINKSSRRIGDIIGVIDGIAFQTNILALNAAVEAARAGEQGLGFAVVASEVRSLAGRSAEAAKEIKGLIGASVGRVEAGSRLVGDAGRTMTEIVGSVQRVSDVIGEITAAAAHQGDGIGHVNSAVGELDRMAQQNATLVEQSAAAAESLRAQACNLADVLRGFRLSAPSAVATG